MAIALSVAVAIASEVVAIPTTNVGYPAVRAVAIACSVAGELSAVWLPVAQFGSPSVATKRYFGFGSVTAIACAVGVWLPLVTPPLADVEPVMVLSWRIDLPAVRGKNCSPPCW
jgi:hypothetical protein